MADLLQQYFLKNNNQKFNLDAPLRRNLDVVSKKVGTLSSVMFPQATVGVVQQKGPILAQPPALKISYKNITRPVVPQKTVKDHAQDLAVDGTKLLITAQQGVVDLMDLGVWGARKAAEGYQQIGHAIAPSLISEPEQAKFGVLSKQLDEGLGVNFNDAKHYWEGFYSDKRKAQQQELQIGKSPEQLNAFNQTWKNAYQNQYNKLQQSGATKDQLATFTQNFNQRHQVALGKLFSEADMSMDKSIRQNLSILGDKFAYVAENPSLGVGAAVESLGYLIPSRAVSKGVIKAEKLLAEAGKSASERAVMAANGVFKPSTYTAAGIAEGSVGAATIAGQLRQESPDGLVDDRGMAAALGGGAITGLIGGAMGKLGAHYGIDDINTIGMQGARSAATEARQLNAPTKAILGTASEAGQEFLQSIGESVLPNIAQGKDPLTGLATDLALGTFAGGIMGAGTNAPQLLQSRLSTASNPQQQSTETAKEQVTQSRFEDMSNPSHEQYNPAAAYNEQKDRLNSQDKNVRQNAQANMDQVVADTRAHRQAVQDQYTNAAATLEQLKTSERVEDQSQIPQLEAELTQLGLNVDKTNAQYLALEKAKTQFENNQQNTSTETAQPTMDLLAQAAARVNGQEAIRPQVTDAVPEADGQQLQPFAQNSEVAMPEQQEGLSSLAQINLPQAQDRAIGQIENDPSAVAQDTMPQQNERNLKDYQDLVTTAVERQDPVLMQSTLEELKSLAVDQTNKAEAFKQAESLIGDTDQKVQVVALGNNEYRVIQDPKQFLSGAELQSNGGVEFSRGAATTKQVRESEDTANQVGQTYQALSKYASRFSFDQGNNNPQENQNNETALSTTTNSIDRLNRQIEPTQPLNTRDSSSVTAQDTSYADKATNDNRGMTSFESVSGMTHHIPNRLLDQTYNIKDVNSELNAVSSPIAEEDKQYSDHLLSQLQQVVPDAKINIVSDLNTVQDKVVKAGLKSGGWYVPDTGISHISPQAEDWHGSAKELINHELIHRATHGALQQNPDVKIKLENLGESIKQYMMDNPETMAAMDETMEDRLDYMSDKADEMLAVGIAETGVRKILEGIIGTDGLKSLDESFQLLMNTKVNNENSRTASSSETVSNTGNSENTQPRTSTKVSESPSTSAESQDNQRSESSYLSDAQRRTSEDKAVMEPGGTVREDATEQSKSIGLISPSQDPAVQQGNERTDSTTSGTRIDGEAQQSNRGLDQENTTEAEETKPTPLQQWFESRKQAPISIKDLRTYLRKSVNGKMGVVFNVIEGLLPKDLTVNYFDMDQIPNGIDMSDVPNHAHAWYDPQTQSINIKSVKSENSKVEPSVVVHELLHAALAQRLDQVRKSPGEYSAAEQALKRLEALRQQLQKRYPNNSTVQGMLENVDEFISYGLTESHLQKLMQAVLVDSKGRTVDKLRSIFKTFVESIGQVLGFKTHQISALNAFVLDTAQLIQAATEISPNRRDSLPKQFIASGPTEKAYQQRIEALFNKTESPKRQSQGIRILDTSDILDMLGYGGYEVQLDEDHTVKSSFSKHPEITLDDWKDLPQWLDKPIAVLWQRDAQGNYTNKMTFITDQIRNGKVVIIGVDPLMIDRTAPSKPPRMHIALTAYAIGKKQLGDAAARNTPLYEDKGKSQALQRKGFTLKWHGPNTSAQGISPILTENDLAVYEQKRTEAKVEGTFEQARAEVKNELEKNTVGYSLNNKADSERAELSTTSVHRSLKEEAVNRTVKNGISARVHVDAVGDIVPLWQDAVKVGESKHGQSPVKHYNALYLYKPEENGEGGSEIAYVARIMMRKEDVRGKIQNVIELTKLMPLDPTAQQTKDAYTKPEDAYYKKWLRQYHSK